MSPPNTLLTVKELANALNCSTASVYRMVQDECIPYYNLRGSYRFNLDEVLTALQNT